MDQQAITGPSLMLVAILGVLVASASLWIWIGGQWRRGRPVVPYSPRRRIRLRGLDILAVVVVYGLTVSGVLWGVQKLFGPVLCQELPDSGQPDTSHLIGQLFGGSVWLMVIGFLSAVVLAPIIEEFLFRVLLQGWLEEQERRWRRALPLLRRMGRGGSVPIVLASLIFASMHYRTHTPHYHAEFLGALLLGEQIAGLLTMAFAVGLLRIRAGATVADLGWAPRKLASDVRLGVLAFLAVGPLIYLLQVGLQIAAEKWWPGGVAPDPVPLFFLALVLGVLYYRTHRIAPSVVLHMSLNFTSVLMLLAGAR